MIERLTSGLSLLGMIVLGVFLTVQFADPAHAGQVEDADRDVAQVHLSYVEPFPHRVYLELNDGSTYSFRNESRCRVHLSRSICREAFRPGYAR